MARRVPREMTVEQYDDWCNATKKFEQVAEAADEVGGPRLSLVPPPQQDIAWPTDLLPPGPPPACLGEGDHAQHGGGGQSEATDPGQPLMAATPFHGIPLRSPRHRVPSQ